jgi:hypothetical protein
MSDFTTLLAEIRRDGIAVLPWGMSRDHVASFNGYLAERKTWEGHVRAKSGGRFGDPARSHSTCWAMEDVVLAPEFLELALSLFPLAQDYLEKPALLYSVNAFTTYPREGPTLPDIQDFHRDRDDSRFIGLFMLCSDVLTAEDGAHQFVRGSHLDGDGRGADGREIVNITGRAGTAFLAATWGLHRGVRPQARPRTLAWARWGVSAPPASYGWDELAPVPAVKLGTRYPADQNLRVGLRLVLTE